MAQAARLISSLRAAFRAGLVAFVLSLTPLAARADEALVQESLAFVSEAVQDFQDGNLAALVERRPDAILALSAEVTGTTPEGVIANYEAAVERSLEQAEQPYAGLVDDSLVYRTTSSGRAFVEGRTEEIWQFPGGPTLHVVSTVVVFEEEGRLRMMPITVADELIALRRVFPDFVDNEFAYVRVRYAAEGLPEDRLSRP